MLLRPGLLLAVGAGLGCAARPTSDEAGISGTAAFDDGSTGEPDPASDTSDASGSSTSDGTGTNVCEIVSPQFALPPSSSLDGMRVVPNDPGLSIEVPANWLTWNEEHANNLHLTRAELEAVREGAGEWDTEYAYVLNALLDFDECSAHVGGGGWGNDGGGYGDLQLRIYRVSETPDEIAAAAMAHAWDTVVPEVSVDDTGPWIQLKLAYDLSYGDYGGRANVDFRMQRVGEVTAIIAGMYTDAPFDGADELAAIVESACWDSGRGECCEL